ncbi:MAG TPA: hypothetical protein ENN67_00275 [Firmicutes bacterium]|nr:hypothetical protein [Bacillota bacterium]
MFIQKPITWCERCFREGPTSSGVYVSPVTIDGHARVKIISGYFCRNCHYALSRLFFIRLVNAFIYTFPGFLIFPVGFSLLVSTARRWANLIPIKNPPEPLNGLVLRYRSSLQGNWNRIHSLVRNGLTVRQIVREIHNLRDLPPRAIYAALRCLESGRKMLVL